MFDVSILILPAYSSPSCLPGLGVSFSCDNVGNAREGRPCANLSLLNTLHNHPQRPARRSRRGGGYERAIYKAWKSPVSPKVVQQSVLETAVLYLRACQRRASSTREARLEERFNSRTDLVEDTHNILPTCRCSQRYANPEAIVHCSSCACSVARTGGG